MSNMPMPPWRTIIDGQGNVVKTRVTDEQEAEYQKELTAYADAIFARLSPEEQAEVLKEDERVMQERAERKRRHAEWLKSQK